MEENKEDTGNKLKEYLSNFAHISEEFSKLPFNLKKVVVNITVTPDLHKKIHTEIELLTGVKNLSPTPDNYNIEISDVTFRFDKS